MEREVKQRLTSYRARGMEKLGLTTRAQLVRAALAQGILD